MTILVGCIVLVGWTLAVGDFRGVLPGPVAMNPVSAVGLLLAGVSAWLLQDERAAQRARWISRVCALVVALFGLTRLIQVLFGLEPGIGLASTRSCSPRGSPLRLLPEQRGRWSNRTIVVGVVVLVAFAASFLWIMPVVYVGLPTVYYLLYIFTTFGAAIALALILAAVLAYKSFDEVEKRAVRLGDATLLASFFWLDLALIILYHVMWVVFLLTLASIWPFRTYSPK